MGPYQLYCMTQEMKTEKTSSPTQATQSVCRSQAGVRPGLQMLSRLCTLVFSTWSSKSASRKGHDAFLWSYWYELTLQSHGSGQEGRGCLFLSSVPLSLRPFTLGFYFLLSEDSRYFPICLPWPVLVLSSPCCTNAITHEPWPPCFSLVSPATLASFPPLIFPALGP